MIEKQKKSKNFENKFFCKIENRTQTVSLIIDENMISEPENPNQASNLSKSSITKKSQNPKKVKNYNKIYNKHSTFKLKKERKIIQRAIANKSTKNIFFSFWIYTIFVCITSIFFKNFIELKMEQNYTDITTQLQTTNNIVKLYFGTFLISNKISQCRLSYEGVISLKLFNEVGVRNTVKSCSNRDYMGTILTANLLMISSSLNLVNDKTAINSRFLIDGPQDIEIVEYVPSSSDNSSSSIKTTKKMMNLRQAASYLSGYSQQVLSRNYSQREIIPKVHRPNNIPWDRFRDPEGESYRQNLHGPIISKIFGIHRLLGDYVQGLVGDQVFLVRANYGRIMIIGVFFYGYLFFCVIFTIRKFLGFYRAILNIKVRFL